MDFVINSSAILATLKKLIDIDIDIDIDYVRNLQQLGPASVPCVHSMRPNNDAAAGGRLESVSR